MYLQFGVSLEELYEFHVRGKCVCLYVQFLNFGLKGNIVLVLYTTQTN